MPRLTTTTVATATAASPDEAADDRRPRARRAVALPPDERRAAIVDATLPLVLAHGHGVTTRQIADAAGIAEGTIFRVFPDKDSLIAAVVDKAFDPEPVEAALMAIDPSLDLEARLVVAVAMMQERFASVWQLMTAIGMTRPPQDDSSSARRRMTDLSALATLFEPDRAQLSRPPKESASLLRGLVLATSHPAIVTEEPMRPEEIVALLLDGIRRRPHGRQR